MIRGNIVMKGYYKNKEATDNAMKNGWFSFRRFSCYAS